MVHFLTESAYMALLHIQAQSIDDFLQRLHLSCQIQISVLKTGQVVRSSTSCTALEYLQFLLRSLGEYQLLVMHLLCRFLDVAGMIGNSLKIADAVQNRI